MSVRRPTAAIAALVRFLLAAAVLLAVELGLGATRYGSGSSPTRVARTTFAGSGLDATVQQVVLDGLDGAACRLGTTREELVLSFGSGARLSASPLGPAHHRGRGARRHALSHRATPNTAARSPACSQRSCGERSVVATRPTHPRRDQPARPLRLTSLPTIVRGPEPDAAAAAALTRPSRRRVAVPSARSQCSRSSLQRPSGAKRSTLSRLPRAPVALDPLSQLHEPYLCRPTTPEQTGLAQTES